MEQIIVKHRDNTPLLLNSRANISGITKAEQKVGLLSDDLTEITVESATPLNFELGDTIDVFGKTYTLNFLPTIKKTGKRKFSYDLTFEGPQYELLDVQFLLPDDTTGDSFTGNLKDFLDVLLQNIRRIFPGKWALGEYPADTEYKTLSYVGENCLSVLQNLCKEHNIEFEIEQTNGVKTLHIRKAGVNFPYTFRYGKTGGLYELTRKNINSKNVVTRLYVYGGSNNLGSKYRYSKLCLPGKTKNKSYIENAAAIAAFGVKENTKTFDKIFPNRYGKVTSLGVDYRSFVDDTMNFDLNEKENDNVTTKWLINGVKPKVKFTTGNLAGYEFECSYDHATKIITIDVFTDERGLKFPSETSAAFQFQAGDVYFFTDINLPDSYKTDAEKQLSTEGTEYYNQNCQPQAEYGLNIDQNFIKQFAGELTIVNLFAVGDYIPVEDTDIGVNKSIRITGFTRDLLKPYKYSLTLGDSVTQSTYTRIISDLKEIDRVIEINDLADPAKARRNWKASQEVLAMVFDPEGDYYSEKIKPLSIETTMLATGARSQQFVLQNTRFEPNYEGNPNTVKVVGGTLVHYTIAETVKSWQLNTATFSNLVSGTVYYIYARCQRSGTAGNIFFDTVQRKVDGDPTYYYFLIGSLSSAITDANGKRPARLIALTYGASTINGRFLTTGRVQSADGQTYFDLEEGEIGGRIKFKTGSGGLKNIQEWPGVQTQIDNAENTAIVAKSLSETANNYIDNVLPGNLEYLQNQIDGQVESWFMPHIPTLTNEPAINWETDLDKQRHIGDTFTNTQEYVDDSSTPDAGKSWRFVSESGTYKWTPIADSDAVKALKEAAKAQDTADGKRRVFTQTPTTPYEIGDLWAQGPSGDLMRCVKSRLSGNYVSSDWGKANKYTDDTIANAAKSAATQAQKAADKAQNSANNAISNINIITDDNIFSATEKKQLLPEWNSIVNEKKDLESTADKYDITDRKTSYLSAYTSIYNYVNPLMSKPNTHSPADGVPFNGSTFRAKFETFYNARNSLYREIEGKAKEIAYNLGLPGRNFALKTGKSITLTGMSGISNDARELYSVLSEATGGDVTLSADVAISGCTFGSNPLIQFQAGNEWNWDLGMWLTIPPTNGMHHVSLSGKIASKSENGKIYFRMDSITGGTITISNLKYERGKKETAWVTAQEDVQSDISYLTNAFPNSETDISGGIVLSSFMGVRGKDNSTITGGMNGDTDNSLPLLFAGAPAGNESLQTRAENSLFNVLNDGSGRWSIFSIDKDRVSIKDTNGNTKIIISNKTIAEESNAADGIVRQFYTDNSLSGGAEGIDLPYWPFWIVEKNYTPNISLSKGNWDNKIRISFYLDLLASFKNLIKGKLIIGYISVDVFLVNINDPEDFYYIYYRKFDITKNVDTSIFFQFDEFFEKSLSMLIAQDSFYTIKIKIDGRMYEGGSAENPLSLGCEIKNFSVNCYAVKSINQNIIASDGISIVYNADQRFEVIKMDGQLRVMASLPSETDPSAIKGQLCVDRYGGVKIKY